MTIESDAIAQYEAQGRWSELLTSLTAMAERAANPTTRVKLNLRVAQLATERFANQAVALAAFERVLTDDPEHEAAIAELEKLYKVRREWDKLAALTNAEPVRGRSSEPTRHAGEAASFLESPASTEPSTDQPRPARGWTPNVLLFVLILSTAAVAYLALP